MGSDFHRTIGKFSVLQFFSGIFPVCLSAVVLQLQHWTVRSFFLAAGGISKSRESFLRHFSSFFLNVLDHFSLNHIHTDFGNINVSSIPHRSHLIANSGVF